MKLSIVLFAFFILSALSKQLEINSNKFDFLEKIWGNSGFNKDSKSLSRSVLDYIEQYKDKQVDLNSLQWMWSYSWQLPGGYLVISFTFNSHIGWRIDDVQLSDSIWNITYSPFFDCFMTCITLADFKYGYFSHFAVFELAKISLPLEFTYDDNHDL